MKIYPKHKIADLGIARSSEAIKIQNEEETRQERQMRLEDTQDHVSKRVKNENE